MNTQEANSSIYYWKHHLIPRHAGGTDDKSNIVKVNSAMHSFLHWQRFIEHGSVHDKTAACIYKAYAGKEWEVADRKSKLVSGEGNPNYGKTHTDEIRSKISKSLETTHPFTGKKRPEHSVAMTVNSPSRGVAWKDYVSEEGQASAKKKLSEQNKGEKNGFYGKKHSEETRKAVSDKAKARSPIGHLYDEIETWYLENRHNPRGCGPTSACNFFGVGVPSNYVGRLDNIKKKHG